MNDTQQALRLVYLRFMRTNYNLRYAHIHLGPVKCGWTCPRNRAAAEWRQRIKGR